MYFLPLSSHIDIRNSIQLFLKNKRHTKICLKIGEMFSQVLSGEQALQGCTITLVLYSMAKLYIYIKVKTSTAEQETFTQVN